MKPQYQQHDKKIKKTNNSDNDDDENNNNNSNARKRERERESTENHENEDNNSKQIQTAKGGASQNRRATDIVKTQSSSLEKTNKQTNNK